MNEEKKKHILIIDDDTFLLDMYTLKFKESGFEVSVGFGSMEALHKLREGLDPDVVLLDIVMPAMDGFELLETIRNESLAPHAKKIILSNLGQDSDIKKGTDLGADGYIVKANATPSEVVHKVIEIIS